MRLHRREALLSEGEFARSTMIARMLAVVWTAALFGALAVLANVQWYLLVVLGAVFVFTAPAPGEIFRSYESYKKQWLKTGGAARGEKAAKINN